MLPDQAQVALQAVPTRAHGNKAPAAAKAYAVQDAREAAIAALVLHCNGGLPIQ